MRTSSAIFGLAEAVVIYFVSSLTGHFAYEHGCGGWSIPIMLGVAGVAVMLINRAVFKTWSLFP